MVTEITDKEPPILITIPEAERLCSLPARVGYRLAKEDWAPFVVRYGERKEGIRIIRAKLLEWANGREAA